MALSDTSLITQVILKTIRQPLLDSTGQKAFQQAQMLPFGSHHLADISMAKRRMLEVGSSGGPLDDIRNSIARQFGINKDQM